MRLPAILMALGADDYQRIVEGLEGLEERLRARDVDESDIDCFAESMQRLAGHEKWEVRRGVAKAARYLRHELFRPILASLVGDKNSEVARAAERTLRQRSERLKVELLPEVLDEATERELAELAARHHPRARQAALRVGVRYGSVMVGTLSHQVRNALMPIEMTLLTMEKKLDDGQAPTRESVRALRQQMAHVQRVLTNAREFARADEPDYRRTSLRKAVDQAIEQTRALPMAQSHGLALSVEIDPALMIEAVESRLVEAISNVLKNAVEASGARRPIPLFIACKRPRGGQIVLTIRDEGCGMTEEQATRDIWRAYGSWKPEGTGLGMPLVKKIITLEHHGEIRLASRVGEGTTITITLPVQQEF